MTDATAPPRDLEGTLRFIERFAAALTDAGIPRMPARVFVALLTTDSGQLTAGELAQLLEVSPAAISGAVRYLMQTDLVTRDREPRARVDHYRLYDDVWYEATLRREAHLTRWETDLRAGVEAVGADTPAGVRLAETVEFLDFLQKELPGLLERWREYRDARRGGAKA